MKRCFHNFKVPQSYWWTAEETTPGVYAFTPQHEDKKTPNSVEELRYPILAKRVFGFKGKGMEKIDSAKEMAEFLTKNNIRGYYFELYYNFAREYRVHCTQTGAFLRWRKLRKTDAENRWFFNSSNCVWVGEDNETFDVPVNMKDIDAKCVEAIKSVGLDIGAVDVRVQGKGNTTPSFIILEVNSAPSLGEMGNKVYAGKIEEIIASKIKDETNIV